MATPGALAPRDPGAKLAHIEACLRPEVEYLKSAGFERLDLAHRALPQLSLDAIDTTLRFLGKPLQAPLMIAPMTGGVGRGHDVNRRLATAAQRHGLAMGLGSVRIAIEQPERAHLYQVRDVAPDVLLFANVGAGQLRAGWGPAQCLQAVRVVQADHLFIHLNPMQEAVQGGDVDFSDTLERVAAVHQALAAEGVTVAVREVGFGLSGQVARQLADVGVEVLDCAGAGGTSWAKVEGLCSGDPRVQRLGQVFGEWGIPTAESLAAVRAAVPGARLIATGGLRSGLDLAKALALGAELGAMARPFLLAADQGEAALEAFIQGTLEELRVAMFGVGARTLGELRDGARLVVER